MLDHQESPEQLVGTPKLASFPELRHTSGVVSDSESPSSLGRSTSPSTAQRTGRWTLDEKILFLYGLKRFGKGRWKKMSVYLPFRSLVQIKSHAQKVLKRLEAGENIFRRLDESYNIIDSLVVQAAKQRELIASTTHQQPKSLAAKRKALMTSRETIPISSPQHFNSNLQEMPSPLHASAPVDSDVAALAASALCQLSSL